MLHLLSYVALNGMHMQPMQKAALYTSYAWVCACEWNADAAHAEGSLLQYFLSLCVVRVCVCFREAHAVGRSVEPIIEFVHLHEQKCVCNGVYVCQGG